MKTARTAAVLLPLVLAPLALSLAATPASAKDGEIRRTGSCSGASDWKLKAAPDDGRLEVEFEVDSNVNGQTWTWRLFHNGDRVAAGTSTTTAPSGSFEVERRVPNAAGVDTLRFRAINARTGEVCAGSLRI